MGGQGFAWKLLSGIMKVILKSDFPLTDEACQSATGKTIAEWFAAMEARGISGGRRDVIQWLYDEMGRGKDVWWATTVWVEWERRQGIVNKKDGLGEGYNICSTKTIAATPEQVYEAWTSAANTAWLGAGPASEGAAFTDDSGNTGSWVRLRPGKDVRMAWTTAAIETPTTVDAAFADKGGGKTGITVTHNRIQTREESDGLRAAWSAALDKLKSQLEVK